MITLFTTFFITEDQDRQNELLLCLQKNNENVFIKNIFLFLDGQKDQEIKKYMTANLIDTNKITFIELGHVPTYGDWITHSKEFVSQLDEISVFTNADIYVDGTVLNLKEFTKDVETIVCLSRHDLNKDNEIVPHPNPHWSQDLWAISTENILKITNTFFIDELNITHTGVYRCDNKLAYIFAMRGWKIFNPFPFIKCYHLQKDVQRSYGRLDINIVGGLCFPSITNDSSTPSELDISVMPVKVGNITKCAINKYLQKNLFPETISTPINYTKEFKPCYTWPSNAIPFREYFTADKLQIFIIENIIHNFNWLKAYRDKITDKHFFFVTLCWNHSEFLCKQTNEIFEILKLNKNNFFFLYNSRQELNGFSKYGFKGDLINHNAWLDENLYSIQTIKKQYDALLIARRAKFKRHYLASKVNNLALIAGGPRHGHTDEIVLPQHVYNNNVPLNLEQVTEKINQSYCGLCLSKEEGACYSSSEYLLCGIPVVSTISEGGRDVWYDDYNSIVCNNTEQDIANSVEFFLNNKRDPEIIRANHITLAKQQRAKFIKTLQQVFFKYNININAFVYYRDNFINKMRTSYKPDFNNIFV